jgi:hypothetical protein
VAQNFRALLGCDAYLAAGKPSFYCRNHQFCGNALPLLLLLLLLQVLAGRW